MMRRILYLIWKYNKIIKNNIFYLKMQYMNAVYARMGDQQVGTPFLNYKDYAGRMTQQQSIASNMSTLKKQMNLPTSTNTFRDALVGTGIGLGNKSLNQWVDSTQKLSNITFDRLYCTSDADCTKVNPTYTCNSNVESWPDAHGNQSGSYCADTKLPEFIDGKFTRLNTTQGGIGKQCFTDADCNTTSGYFCNNSTDTFGHNIEQTGFCAQTFDCGDDVKRFVGYPAGSSVPISPPINQNNNGTGYTNLDECQKSTVGGQRCSLVNGRYFATYPGYCPVSSSLREGSNPTGALTLTSLKDISRGLVIPAYANSLASSIGSSSQITSVSRANALMAGKGGESPLEYEMRINPRPSNYTALQ